MIAVHDLAKTGTKWCRKDYCHEHDDRISIETKITGGIVCCKRRKR